MNKWKSGTLVELDGLVAVVVQATSGIDVPDDHVLVWFGDPQGTRNSQRGSEGLPPEIWLVPEDLLGNARPPVIKH